MADIFTVEILVSFLTLCSLELILGVDNVIFISILAAKLPKTQQAKARMMGLSLAVITRILLLMSLSWIIKLTAPLFSVMDKSFSGRDLILLLGGLFLLAKSTFEIHEKIEGDPTEKATKVVPKFANVVFQILLIDIVFSLDSVITAVGMVDSLAVMVAAVVVSTAVMILSAKKIADFIEEHPTFKMLALSFLLLIGVTLVADGLGQHFSKAYIYSAIGFSLFVEVLNLKMRKKKKA